MNFLQRLSSGSQWEDKVKEYFELRGYTVEKYECLEMDGESSSPQYYVYIDGSTNNPHPDLILSMDSNKRYVEVKSFSDYHHFEGKNFLYVNIFNFESYLKLSKWKSISCHIVFIVQTRDNRWYMNSIDYLNDKKIEFPFKPDKYFWNIKDLKRIK